MIARTPDRSKSKQAWRIGLVAAFALLIASVFTTTGCQVAPPTQAAGAAGLSEPQTIREGDVIKISFPGAQNLDSTQQVRRDGRVTLAMVGEMKVSGKTPSDVEKELLQTYGNQLVTKEVSVTVVSSSYAVFVSGAVIRPGKINPDHTITALEAIMEAGGFDMTRANMEAVTVIRMEEGKTKNYVLNLKAVIDGKSHDPFYLKPSDIVHVPEKFSWF